MILINAFYKILLIIGDPILLCGFKIGEYVLDLSGMGAIFFGHSLDVDLILYNGHECRVELLMGNVEIFSESEEVDG